MTFQETIRRRQRELPAAANSGSLTGRISRLAEKPAPRTKSGWVPMAVTFGLCIIFIFGISAAAQNSDTPKQGRILHFPKDRSLGRITIRDADVEERIEHFHYFWHAKSECLGEATGDVTIPPGKKAALFLNEETLKDLSPLLNLAPDDLYMLSVVPTDWRKKFLLSGEDMKNISHLSGLKVLWISHASAATQSFKHLTKLKSLEILIPPKGLTNRGLLYIAEMKSLKRLYLVDNKITNAGLEYAIPNMTNLEVLSLWSGEISDDGLSCLEKLPKLHYLSLNSGNFTDAGLSHLQHLTTLKSLDLSHLAITDNGLRHLSGLKLEDLNLFNTEVANQGLACLTSMPLKKLALRKRGQKNQITDAGMVHLAQINSLEHLELPGGITDNGFTSIAQLKNLKYLWVSGASKSPLTDIALKQVSKLQSLEYLRIGGTNFSDAGMVNLTKLANLKELGFSVPDSMTNDGLIHLKELKNLEKLDLSFCKNITISGLSHLNALKKLSKLQIDFGMIQDGSGLDISGLTELEELSLKMDAPIYNKDLVCLKHLTKLKRLIIGGGIHCAAVTDAGMEHLKDLENLTELYCRSPYLTDNSLTTLAAMKSMRYLSVCGNFTDKGLSSLEKANQLRTLTVQSSNKFSPAAIDHLRQELPYLMRITAEQDEKIKSEVKNKKPLPTLSTTQVTAEERDNIRQLLDQMED